MLFMVPVPDNMDVRDAADRARLEREIVHFGAGGVVFMAGDPLEHASIAGWLDSQTDVPLVKALDAEWGTGMRHRDMPVYARAMGLAASRSVRLTREVGFRTGRAARATGISMVFAPVADVNTEGLNPVIGTRAFSDHPDTVAVHAAAFAAGLRNAGVAAVAKHFPGHGSTTLDSHVALPRSGHTAGQLSNVDLVPFRRLIADSIAGLMTAHVLYSEPDNLPATLDSTLLTVLLRDSLSYGGLIVTDALNMAGVTSTGSAESVAVNAVLAGADILLMSPDPFAARAALLQAVREGLIPEERINASVRRILGERLSRTAPPDLVALMGLAEQERSMSIYVATRALTLIKHTDGLLPGDRGSGRVVILETDFREHTPASGPGPALGRHLSRLMPDAVDVVRISPRTWRRDLDRAAGMVRRAHTVIWLEATGVTPVAGWDISAFGRRLNVLHDRVVGMAVGSPWTLPSMAPSVRALLVSYDALESSLRALARAFVGRAGVTGRLPVHVSDAFPRGSGLDLRPVAPSTGPPHTAGMDAARLQTIDRIVHTAMADSAFPAATAAIGRGETLTKLGAWGHPDWETDAGVETRAVFDLASLTKVIATTTMVMLMVEDGTLELDRPVAEYVPEFGQNGKDMITIRDLLSHTGGLIPFRAFYADGVRSGREVRRRILADSLNYQPGQNMRYSDFGPITLVWVMEAVTGQPFEQLVQDRVFGPLRMYDTGFRPARRQQDPRTIPTEVDNYFRYRTLNGEVHDENAWLLGGTAGHAGLFSTAEDLATFAMMYVNEGRVGNQQFLKPETIRLFTSRVDPGGSHTRALGWDTRSRTGYSSAGAHFGPNSFGHTGFTGTSFWIDPDQDLYVILLTNRVHPTRNNSGHVPVRPAVANQAFLALDPD